VEFFGSPKEAEGAGYRACARCRPAEASRQLRAVEAACRQIDGNLDRNLPLGDLSRVAGLSPFHLSRLFRRHLGVTVRQYRQARRLDHLKEKLNTQSSVTDAIYEAGYGSASRVYEIAGAQLGMTPSSYRNGAPAAEIVYTIFDSALGKALLAATQKGVCAIRLGDDKDLVQGLKREFAAAVLRQDDAALRHFASAVNRHLAEGAPAVDLPLDIRATAFQSLVWNALRAIPRGQTRTYSEVAEAIGRPRAVRAVANACAQNPVALAIPCHRVVHRDGRSTGYRWGAERKRKLLEMEGVQERVLSKSKRSLKKDLLLPADTL
jgi:AraC family transcriptional regulator of adaptative response/methylated-DNA-[protein]-cysteine methyltransferase